MENELEGLDQKDLLSACSKVQNLLMEVALNPVDGLDIAATVFVNFVASGIACGAIDEEQIPALLEHLNSTILKAVTLIKSEKSQTTQTVQ